MATRETAVGTQTQTVTPTSTRDRLVEAARELFWANGYEATSVAQILERADVNSGSLYYFFASKEELLLAVLDRYSELLWPVLMQPAFETVEDPIERIFELLAGYRKRLEENGCRRGCPIGNLALEVSDMSPAARAKIAHNFDAWSACVRRCLEEAKEGLPDDVDLDGLAALTLTTMEGAVMQARTKLSLEPFDRSVAQLRDYVDRLVASAESAA